MPEGSFVAVPGVVRVVVAADLSGRPHVNVLHMMRVESLGDYSQVEVDAIATGFRAAWVSHLLAVSMSAFTLRDVTVTDLGSVLGRVGIATGSNPGTNAGSTLLPVNCCMCVSWKVNLHYRGGHPRTYIGGQGIANVLGANQWNSSFLTVVARPAVTSFLTAVNAIAAGGNTFRLCSIHRTVGKLPQTPPLAAPIIAGSVDARIDSQRRRLGKDVA